MPSDAVNQASDTVRKVTGVAPATRTGIALALLTIMISSVIGPLPARAETPQVRWYMPHEVDKPLDKLPPADLKLVRFVDAGALVGGDEHLQVQNIAALPDSNLLILSLREQNTPARSTFIRAYDAKTHKKVWEISKQSREEQFGVLDMDGVRGGQIVVGDIVNDRAVLTRRNPKNGVAESWLDLPDDRIPVGFLGTLDDGRFVVVSLSKQEKRQSWEAPRSVHLGKPGQKPDVNLALADLPEAKTGSLLLPAAVSGKGILLLTGLQSDKTKPGTLIAYDLGQQKALWEAERPGFFITARIDGDRATVAPWLKESLGVFMGSAADFGQSVFVHNLAHGEALYAFEQTLKADTWPASFHFLGTTAGVDVYVREGEKTSAFGVDARTGRRLWEIDRETQDEFMYHDIAYADPKSGQITVVNSTAGVRFDAKTGQQTGVVRFEDKQNEHTNVMPILIRLGDNWITRINGQMYTEKIEPLNLTAKIPNGEQRINLPGEPMGTYIPDRKIAAAALIKALQNERVELRRRGAEDLANLPYPPEDALPAVAALSAALQDKDEQVRQLSALALYAIGPGAKQAAGSLVELLADKSDQMRLSAAVAIAAVEPDGVSAPKAAIVLREFLSQKETGNRITAIEGLLRIKAESAGGVAALTKELDAGNEEAREAACHLVDRLATHDDLTGRVAPLVPALIHRLESDKGKDVRWAAANALGGLGTVAEQARPALVKSLKDSEDTVRRFSIQALGQIGLRKEELPLLQEAMSDEGFGVASAAAQALAHNKEAGIPLLASLLDSKDSALRQEAITGLTWANADAAPALAGAIRLAKEQDLDAAKMAIQVLGNIGEKGVPTLLELLDTVTDVKLHQCVVNAMANGAKGVASAAGPLSERLKRTSPKERREAAMLLGQIGPAAKSALPALKSAAADMDAEVGKAAVEAIRSIEAKH